MHMGWKHRMGVITCTKFTDAIGRRYDDWTPAVRFGW